MTGGSRFGAPRGSVPRIVAEAADLAEQRLSLTMKLLDDATTAGKVGTLGGGTRLQYDAFRALLTSDEAFRQQVANRWLFASPKERERLLKEIQRVFPAGKVTGTQAGQGSQGLPPEVVSPPPSSGGVPPDQLAPGAEMGMGLGGPTPGAAPLPGTAPPPGIGSGLPPAPNVPPSPVTPLQQMPPGAGLPVLPPPGPGGGLPPAVLNLLGPLPQGPPPPLPLGPEGQPLPALMPMPAMPIPPGV